MRILVGYVTALHSSGVDKYLLGVLRVAESCGVQLDFLTSQYDADTDAALRARGCRLYAVPSLKNPYGHYTAVRNILRDTAYDKAYFNISEPLNMMGAKAAHDSGVLCIVHSHSSGMDIANTLKRRIRGVINAFCRPLLTHYADVCLACSRVAGEWLFTRRAVRSDKFAVMYNAVDTSAFGHDAARRIETRAALGLDDNTLAVGHIGSYCYAKNNFFLVDIAAALAETAPHAVMLCVGDGDDRDAVMAYAAARGVSERMRFLGVRKDVPALLDAMDAFVLPSRFEGAPIVAIEAQAAGLPCLISDRVTDEVMIAPATVQLPIDNARRWADRLAAIPQYAPREGILPSMLEHYSLDRQQQQMQSLLFN